MKLKFFFFILSLLLVAVWGVLLVLSFKERGMLFYMVEGIITFSLIFLIFFYRKVIKPLDTIGNGMDLLREQDCTCIQPHDGTVERRTTALARAKSFS